MGYPRYLVYIFLVCLTGDFWMSLTVEQIEWVKQNALPNVCGSHPISWMPRQSKKAKREFLLSYFLQAWVSGCWFFLPVLLYDSEWKSGSSWVLSLWTSGPELHYWLSWVSSLPTANLGNCQPPQSHEPIPYNPSLSLSLSLIYMYIYINKSI